MKSHIHDLLVFTFFLGVLLVPLLLGLFLSLQIAHGLTRARQTFLRLLKIGAFLALSVSGVVLLGNTLYMFLV
jgi:hypothetical protein